MILHGEYIWDSTEPDKLTLRTVHSGGTRMLRSEITGEVAQEIGESLMRGVAEGAVADPDALPKWDGK